MSSSVNIKSKKGAMLIEVIIAIIIISIVSVAMSSSLVSATRARMKARTREAALIEATSQMELVYAMASTNNVAPGDSGFFDTTGTNLTWGADPGLTWTFDGAVHSEQVTFTNEDNFLTFQVNIDCEDNNNPVTLIGAKYLQQ